MADNPYAARPVGGVGQSKKNECLPDMPRGGSEADRAARVRFWLERGDRSLAEAGKQHLHWCHSNGNYWIEERY